MIFLTTHNKPENLKKKNWLVKIPLFTGGRCEAVFPATASYARAVMLLYHPWSGRFTVKRSCPSLLARFEKFINNLQRCPKVVRVAYDRARMMKHKMDPTTSTSDIAYDTVVAGADEETIELVDLVGTIFTEDDYADDELCNLDFGKDHDWSNPCVKVSMGFACVR